MENNRIQRIYLMLYLRIILITKSSEDIKTAYSNEIEELVVILIIAASITA